MNELLGVTYSQTKLPNSLENSTILNNFSKEKFQNNIPQRDCESRKRGTKREGKSGGKKC